MCACARLSLFAQHMGIKKDPNGFYASPQKSTTRLAFPPPPLNLSPPLPNHTLSISPYLIDTNPYAHMHSHASTHTHTNKHVTHTHTNTNSGGTETRQRKERGEQKDGFVQLHIIRSHYESLCILLFISRIVPGPHHLESNPDAPQIIQDYSG